jgi:NAD(P)H dehydrogenase (quinone)
MTQTVTVFTIAGSQQSAVAARFAEAGWSIRGTSRKSFETAHGPTIVADIETREGLAASLRGADAAVFTLPQDHRSGVMPRLAANIAHAAAETGVGRLILNTAGVIDAQSAGSLFTDMRAARDAVRASGVPFVILQPTVFMDNLLAPWSLPGILEQGVLAYPAPENARISWISHRSLADYVYSAATLPEVAGRDLVIGGPEALSGHELCAQLGERLGRTIRYQRIPLDGFAAGLDQAFGPPAGQRIASLYARLDREPDAMTVDPRTSSTLHVLPEGFAAFAARQNWEMPPH